MAFHLHSLEVTKTEPSTMETSMKRNIYEKYTIIATYLLVVLFGAFAHAARTYNNSDTTTRSTFLNMEPSRENEMRPHVGLQLGYAEPGKSYDPATQYGIEVGYQPYVPLAAAVELSTFLSDADNADNLRRSTLMAKGTYNFGGDTTIIKHSFLGAAIGPVYDTQGSNREWNLGLKYLAGVDIPLTGNGTTRTKSFSLGATASYMSVANAQDNFLLNGQLKYWF
jgi:hypothetical protein